VPAPTACVGDVCGATSCARRALKHRMLWTARGLGHQFWMEIGASATSWLARDEGTSVRLSRAKGIAL